jgi:cytidylate kinase
MKVTRKIIVAIDGHSSCGKSTVAKDLAKVLSIAYIDTGAMYRAVTLYALRNNLIDNDIVDEKGIVESLSNISVSFTFNSETKSNETFLNGKNVEKDIRTLEVSNKVSYVSAIGSVRKQLVKWQRDMGSKQSVVMDGRDIGTVVFPNADIKIFMTASDEVRAKRRYDELTSKGENVTMDEVLNNIKERDYIDSTRAESPLRKAEDAILLDNSKMSIEDQFDWIIEKMRSKMLIQ